MIFTKVSDLFVADADGANPRKLVSVKGQTYLPSVSPDGRRIAFSHSAIEGGIFPGRSWIRWQENAGLWTMVAPRGAASGPLTASICCSDDLGSDARHDIWAIPMEKTLFRRSSRPIQLTAGPLSYSGVSVSRDGKQIFAIGTTDRGELVRYDMKSHEFVPFLSGISATFPTFSRDGQWIAYRFLSRPKPVAQPQRRERKDEADLSSIGRK